MKGSYQAGAIYGLMEKGDREQLGWDVISGVSAGALNAAAIGMFPKN
jgi:predicted acylesterase/phospholipase RssA